MTATVASPKNDQVHASMPGARGLPLTEEAIVTNVTQDNYFVPGKVIAIENLAQKEKRMDMNASRVFLGRSR